MLKLVVVLCSRLMLQNQVRSWFSTQTACRFLLQNGKLFPILTLRLFADEKGGET